MDIRTTRALLDVVTSYPLVEEWEFTLHFLNADQDYESVRPTILCISPEGDIILVVNSELAYALAERPNDIPPVLCQLNLERWTAETEIIDDFGIANAGPSIPAGVDGKILVFDPTQGIGVPGVVYEINPNAYPDQPPRGFISLMVPQVIIANYRRVLGQD